MKPEDLFDAITEVKEEYIDEAQQMPEKRYPWKKWGVLAACLCAVLGVGFLLFPSQGPEEPMPTEQQMLATGSNTAPTEPSEEPAAQLELPTEPPEAVSIDGELPKLEVSNYFGAMGYEGYSVYDLEEEDSGNPWTEEMQLETMPVYQNLAYTDRAGTPNYLTEDQMSALAQQAGRRIIELQYSGKYDGISEEYRSYHGVITEDFVIEGQTTGAIRLNLYKEKSVKKPDSLEEAQTLAAQLTEEYGIFLTDETLLPQAWGSYDIYGEGHWQLGAYPASDDPMQSILNYNFRSLHFHIIEGSLRAVDFSNRFLSMQKLGDYPVITADEARKLLLNGNFVTSVPSEELRADTVREEDIAAVELVYRTGNVEQVFMPYYRFSIRLRDREDEKSELGLKNYGAFYVPAVESEYLTEMPVWDGTFN